MRSSVNRENFSTGLSLPHYNVYMTCHKSLVDDVLNSVFFYEITSEKVDSFFPSVQEYILLKQAVL